MVPPSVSAALAPTAKKAASFRMASYTNIELYQITIGVLKLLPSSANSIKAKRSTELGSPQIRQSTTYK